MKSTHSIPFGKKIGILGGGQLARLLCLEGFKLGYEMHVLSANYEDPAAQVTRFWHQGDIENVETLERFFHAVDYITTESEFISCRQVKEASDATAKTVTPSIDWIEKLSDRLTQKNWLLTNKIPTADFIHPTSTQEIETFFSNKRQGIVLKKRRFGYDGYGTFIIQNQEQLKNWINEHQNHITDFIAEELLTFRCELAVQITIGSNKKAMVFPLVHWQAQNSKCLWVKGPVKSARADRLIQKITKSLIKGGYVGTVAFEFFDSQKDIIVNEVAPRVHNSGHATLEACVPNQFSAHLMALTGISLPPKPKINAKGFAMYNLIGSDNSTAKISLMQEIYFHWYGKDENRPGRKMGHLTALAKSPDLALGLLKKAIKSGTQL